jgi:hypothetical protein
MFETTVGGIDKPTFAESQTTAETAGSGISE